MMLPKILSYSYLNGLSSATDMKRDEAVVPVPAQPYNQPYHGANAAENTFWSNHFPVGSLS